MRVNQFDGILIWPFRLEGERRLTRSGALKVDHEATLEDWAEKLTAIPSSWHRAETSTAALGDIEYGERVYFHPFVQQFFYGRGEAKAALRRFERGDVGRVRIQFKVGTVELDVGRVELLMDVRVAVLVIGISSRAPMNLDDVLKVRDQFRRVYPPFWIDDDPGLCPERVDWLDNSGAPIMGANSSDFKCKQVYSDFVRQHNTALLAGHWRWLLEPLAADVAGRPASAIGYRHIGDERMPEMGYVELSAPLGLSRSDLVRLTFLDGPDTGMPYSSGFLEGFEKTYCYDRFWDPGAPGQMLTRYLNCGFGFTMVTSGEPSYLRRHFGSHYFRMGLIAHFQKAWLLVLEDELFSTVASLKARDYEGFRRSIEAVHEEIAEFTTRYWFTEVSNQVQPQELFDMWLKRLGTEKLYQQLLAEVESVDEVLNAVRERRRNRQMMVLTWVATVGLALSLGVNFLGMNVVSRDLDKWYARLFGTLGGRAMEWATFLGASVAFFGVLWVVKRWVEKREDS